MPVFLESTHVRSVTTNISVPDARETEEQGRTEDRNGEVDLLFSDGANSTQAAYHVRSWTPGAQAARAAAQPGKFLKVAFKGKIKLQGAD